MWQLLQVFFMPFFKHFWGDHSTIWNWKLDKEIFLFPNIFWIFKYIDNNVKLVIFWTIQNIRVVQRRSYIVMKSFVMGPLHAETSIFSKIPLLAVQLKNLIAWILPIISYSLCWIMQISRISSQQKSLHAQLRCWKLMLVT